MSRFPFDAKRIRLCSRVRPWLTVHVESLHDDGQLHLAGHVPQRPHGHSQLLLGNEPVSITIQHPKRFPDLCQDKQQIHSQSVSNPHVPASRLQGGKGVFSIYLFMNFIFCPLHFGISLLLLSSRPLLPLLPAWPSFLLCNWSCTTASS